MMTGALYDALDRTAEIIERMTVANYCYRKIFGLMTIDSIALSMLNVLEIDAI